MQCVQDITKDAQKKAQPVIDDVKAKAAEAQSRAGELQSQAQRQAQPVFDSAKEQYQQAEKSALKAKDDALKQAQPAVDDAKQRSSEVRPLSQPLSPCKISFLYRRTLDNLGGRTSDLVKYGLSCCLANPYSPSQDVCRLVTAIFILAYTVGQPQVPQGQNQRSSRQLFFI